MKTELTLILSISLFIIGNVVKAQVSDYQSTITISGRVSDFEGNPIDSSVVRILHKDFDKVYETYTDKNGNYTLKNIDKGNYMAMFVMRTNEYPRENKVSKDKMRLEYWAWNIIAEKDLIINPRYDKLEIYGTTAYEVYGGYSGFFIYFRPMSLKKYLSYSEFLNKEKSEKNVDISIKPENLKIKVYANDEPLVINSIQSIKEFSGKGNIPITAFIVQVDKPKQMRNGDSYIVFRVEAENTEFNEKGESIYFYETKKFK